MLVQFTMDSRSLEAKLKSLAGEEQKKIMQTALRAGGKVFKDAVLENTPVRVLMPNDDKSTALPPGALKSDVTLRKKPNQMEYDVYFGNKTAHVARWVDEGHRLVRGGRSRTKRRHGKIVRVGGPGRVVGDVPGTGFFRKSFEEAQTKAAKVIEETFVSLVQRKWEGK